MELGKLSQVSDQATKEANLASETFSTISQ